MNGKKAKRLRREAAIKVIEMEKRRQAKQRELREKLKEMQAAELVRNYNKGIFDRESNLLRMKKEKEEALVLYNERRKKRCE